MPSPKNNRRHTPTYRGEIIEGVAGLTNAQIADRVRCAVAIDGEIEDVIKQYASLGDPASQAVVAAYRALLNLGLSSIIAAEYRIEVKIFTERKKTGRVTRSRK